MADLQYNAQTIGDCPKKEAVEWFQKSGTLAFLKKHKLNGDTTRVAKNRSKPDLIAAFKDLVENNLFGTDESREAERKAEEAEKALQAEAAAASAASAAAAAVEEVSGPVERVEDFVQKNVTKKGEKGSVVKKGDTIKVHYTGKLEDGTVFDSSWDKKGKKSTPIAFKVGAGKVIKGWDEGVVGMCVNECATLTIKPSWAYGKKGAGEGKIPPNATLVFDIQIASIEN